MTDRIKCIGCNGAGSDYLFKDRDPIEGYKLADKKVCMFCEGRGTIGIDDYRYEACLAYARVLGKKQAADKKLRERREAERAALVASAKAKLSPDELKALGVSP